MKEKKLFNHKELLQVPFTGETIRLFVSAIKGFSAAEIVKYRDKNITTDRLCVSSRVINDWTIKGLIPDTRDNVGKGFARKFSAFEYAYIELLKELREANVSIGQLKELKKLMEIKIYNDLSLLEIALIMASFKTYGNIYLIMNKVGKCIIGRKKDFIPLTSGFSSLGFHIEVQLNKIWKGKLKNVGVWDEALYIVNQDELDATRFATHPKMKALVARLEAEEAKNESTD